MPRSLWWVLVPFRGLLPPSPTLTRMYLHTSLAWKLLGKQFLVIARKP
ncbi:MAG TPA: hypothetical protein VF482_09995 [Trebonia sp.]